MKKWILLLGVLIFSTAFTAKVFSQESAEVMAMRFTHDFNITGLKTEQQAAWIDSVITHKFPEVISCVTDFKTSHTKMVVHESLNSPELIRKIFVKLGCDIEQTSYVSKKD